MMPDVNAIAVAIWSTMLALPGPYYPPGKAPETCAARAERLTVIAYAIALETHDADLWAEGWTRGDWLGLGLSVTYTEGWRWRLEVHDGRIRGDRGASVCLAQVMGGGAALVGVSLPATRRCVREMFRHLQLHQTRCRALVPTRETVARVWAGYGTGSSCNADHVSPVLGAGWARRRAALWARFRKPAGVVD